MAALLAVDAFAASVTEKPEPELAARVRQLRDLMVEAANAPELADWEGLMRLLEEAPPAVATAAGAALGDYPAPADASYAGAAGASRAGTDYAAAAPASAAAAYCASDATPTAADAHYVSSTTAAYYASDAAPTRPADADYAGDPGAAAQSREADAKLRDAGRELALQRDALVEDLQRTLGDPENAAAVAGSVAALERLQERAAAARDDGAARAAKAAAIAEEQAWVRARAERARVKAAEAVASAAVREAAPSPSTLPIPVLPGQRDVRVEAVGDDVCSARHLRVLKETVFSQRPTPADQLAALALAAGADPEAVASLHPVLSSSDAPEALAPVVLDILESAAAPGALGRLADDLLGAARARRDGAMFALRAAHATEKNELERRLADAAADVKRLEDDAKRARQRVLVSAAVADVTEEGAYPAGVRRSLSLSARRRHVWADSCGVGRRTSRSFRTVEKRAHVISKKRLAG